MKQFFGFFCIGIFFIAVIFGIFFFRQSERVIGENDLHFTKNIVKIFGKKNGIYIYESMGYKLQENLVISSLHGVKNSDTTYEISGEKWNVVGKDAIHDIAILANINIFSEGIFFEKGNVGDEIYAFVFRDGKLKKIHGKIIAINIETYAINDNGSVEKFILPIQTDLPVRRGDSGTPIFGKNGNIIDVIHIIGG